MKLHLTLLGDCPSAKNSRQLIYVKGRPRVIANGRVRAWITRNEFRVLDFKTQNRKALTTNQNRRIAIHFLFYRSHRRRFDYINLAQAPLDLLVRCGVLADDSADHVLPIFSDYVYDRHNPRTELTFDLNLSVK